MSTLEKDAVARVLEIMKKPMAEQDDVQTTDHFDPWDIFPQLYGSYNSDFDDLALDILQDLQTLRPKRKDLAAEMFREMLCTANLCDYGSSPRVCFPTREFAAILPQLIERWETYRQIQWGE
jgi:hypothetical protein